MSQHTNLGNIAVPVGSYQSGNETKKRFRNIGVLMKTTDNGSERYWIKLNADIFHASLYALIRQTSMEKGDDMVSAAVFEPRDEKKPAARPDAAADEDGGVTPF